MCRGPGRDTPLSSVTGQIVGVLGFVGRVLLTLQSQTESGRGFADLSSRAPSWTRGTTQKLVP